MEQIFITTNPKETQDVAIDLVDQLTIGTTICLVGDLASGKTTFTQGIGLALNLSRVVSPTYMIMREYKVEEHPTIKKLFHLDLYRLGSPEDIKAFDLAEIWADPQNLVVIEWPEKVVHLLPKDHYFIDFKQTGHDQREIRITRNKP